MPLGDRLVVDPLLDAADADARENDVRPGHAFGE
jgi:hypothetical protein